MKRFHAPLGTLWPLVWILAAGVLAPGPAGAEAGAGARKDLVLYPASGPLAGKRIYGSSFALLVGINEYAHLPRDKWLDYAVNDIQGVRDVLVKSYGFPEENITLLRNGEATTAAIRKALARLADRRYVQPDDRVLIYFSGHGQTVKLQAGGEMGFLIPYDAEVDFDDVNNPGPYLETCLPMKAVWDYLESSPARHILVLADACYSGLLARPRATTDAKEEVLAALAGQRAVQVVTAGRRGEVSFEQSRYGHGAFTYRLIEELKRRAEIPGAVFTATELYGALKRGVADLSGGKQTPQMGDCNTEGDFLFITAGGLPPEEGIQAGQVWVNPKEGSEMVYVPAGAFTMGLDAEEVEAIWERMGLDPAWRAGGALVAMPKHQVSLPGFWISKHEVTFAQYARFLRETGRPAPNDGSPWLKVFWIGDKPAPGRDNQPAVCTKWTDARAYAEWAGCRLPTEAEWEKAARGTDARVFPWGNDWDLQRCNTIEWRGQRPLRTNAAIEAWRKAGYPGVQEKYLVDVGSFPAGASPYGCMEMAGNAQEWTASIYRPYPYDPNDGREDAWMPGLRVNRGGSMYTAAHMAISAVRNAPEVEFASNGLGFRLARSAAPVVTLASTAEPQGAARGPALPMTLDLFNGRNLAGWISNGARWSVTDGVLRCTKGEGWLNYGAELSAKAFNLEIRLKVVEGMRCRIALVADSQQLKIANEGETRQFALYGPDLDQIQVAADPGYVTGQWYDFRVEAEAGGTLRLSRDGVVTHTARWAHPHPLRIGISPGDGHSPGRVEVASVKLTLRAAAAPSPR